MICQLLVIDQADYVVPNGLDGFSLQSVFIQFLPAKLVLAVTRKREGGERESRPS